MLSHDCQIRVWYKHTDQMAICHHSNYICYYEAARSELLRYLGMSFAEVEKRGIMMPILEVQSKYHRPAYYDELLTVRIMLRELPTARINFFYEIYNERGDLLNTGMTQLGFIHSDTRRPCRVPDWFLQLVTNKWTEELARSVTMSCGASVSVSLYPMSGKQMKEFGVHGIVTRSQQLGKAIRTVKDCGDQTPEEHFLEMSEGFKLFKGKIADVLRETRAGFNFGKVVLEGHIKHCVRDGIQHGDADKTIENFTKAVERFSNMG